MSILNTTPRHQLDWPVPPLDGEGILRMTNLEGNDPTVVFSPTPNYRPVIPQGITLSPYSVGTNLPGGQAAIRLEATMIEFGEFNIFAEMGLDLYRGANNIGFARISMSKTLSLDNPTRDWYQLYVGDYELDQWRLFHREAEAASIITSMSATIHVSAGSINFSAGPLPGSFQYEDGTLQGVSFDSARFEWLSCAGTWPYITGAYVWAGSSGMWSTRQRQTPNGTVGGHALRQRQNAGNMGGWPSRER